MQVLRKAISYSNMSRLREIVRRLEKEGYTFIDQDCVHLTSKGVAWIEENVDMELEY
jgi:predicted methyltransferase